MGRKRIEGAKYHDSYLKVWVMPEERRAIEEKARLAGLPVAMYLRRVGMGMVVKAVVDREQIAALAKEGANLGRLGGLLKLWLTDEDRRRGLEGEIRRLLRALEDSQKKLREIIDKI